MRDHAANPEKRQDAAQSSRDEGRARDTRRSPDNETNAEEKALVALIQERVIPRMVEAHKTVITRPPSFRIPDPADIARLTHLILGQNAEQAETFVQTLHKSGVPTDSLFLDFIEPAARAAGEAWVEDTVDFLDVTIAAARLHRLANMLERLDPVAPHDAARRALVVPAPGEKHTLGTAIVQRFLRAAGWHVGNGRPVTRDDISTMVGDEWFVVVGFSLSSDLFATGLERMIRTVREQSANPSVAILVGGAAFSRDPTLATSIGADGIAPDGRTSVHLAERFLAEQHAKGLRAPTTH